MDQNNESAPRVRYNPRELLENLNHAVKHAGHETRTMHAVIPCLYELLAREIERDEAKGV